MAARNWNPLEPMVLGLEWPGMREVTLPLSQDAEYGYTFEANATETIDIARFLLVDPSVSAYSVSTGLVTVYERGDETAVGTVQSTICLVNGGSLVGGASLAGTGTVQEALASPADAKWVQFNAAAEEVTLEFSTIGKFTGKRILEVKVHYVASSKSDNDDPTVLLLVSTGATVGINGLVAVDPFGATSSPVRVVSLGECNYAVAGNEVWPWTVADVESLDTSGIDIRFQQSASDIDLHYVAVEVVWCEENRVATGGLILRQGKEAPTVGTHRVLLRTPAGVDNWSKAANVWYTVTVCSARSPGPFTNAIEDIAALTMKQTQGDPPMTVLVDSFDVAITHAGRVAPRTAANVLRSAEDDSRICPVVFLTTSGPPNFATDHAPYDKPFAAEVYTGSSAKAQEITQRSGSAAVQYRWVSFYVRRIGNPSGTITISANGGAATTTITDAEIQALDEIWDGWRRAIVEFTGTIPVYDNSATDSDVVFTTGAGSDIANRYEILGVNTLRLGGDLPTGASASGAGTYGEAQVSVYKDGGSPRIYSDLVVTMHTSALPVSDFATIVNTVPLTYEDEACANVCRVPSLKAVVITFTPSGAPADKFSYSEIQRKDTYDTTWRTIAKLIDPAQSSWVDNEARHGGVTSDYRMRFVRSDGIAGDWSATQSETITDDVDAPCGTLFFTSNWGNTQIAYGETFDGDPRETFEFVEAGDVVTQRHFGRFGSQSFHPTERGGVSFERTVIVNQLAATPDALMQNAWDALRNLAWADNPYVCIVDDIGNRWFGTLIVPDAVFARSPGIHMASIRFIESTDVPFPDAS